MAKIFPFKAVRPKNGDTECFEMLFKEEYSAAGSSPEIIDAPLSSSQKSSKKFDLMQAGRSFTYLNNRYNDFKSQQILIRDPKPAVYIHRITKEDNEFTGIILATSVDDYEKGDIVKHEDTILPRVERFKEYLAEARFTTEPVLLTYGDDKKLNKWVKSNMSGKPDYIFETVGHDSHALWKIDDETQLDLLTSLFESIPNLYIADGHHRCASSSMLAREDHNAGANCFMSFVIPESQLKIYGFDWMINGLNGYSETEFLAKLSETFAVTECESAFRPKNEREFVMYLHKKAYVLTLRQAPATDTIQDPHILLDTIIRPLLAIEDIRSDRRIGYEPGKNQIGKTLELIDKNVFDIAFFLCPPKFSSIKKVADAGLTMPPKSTYIEPKFRNALVVYEL